MAKIFNNTADVLSRLWSSLPVYERYILYIEANRTTVVISATTKAIDQELYKIVQTRETRLIGKEVYRTSGLSSSFGKY